MKNYSCASCRNCANFVGGKRIYCFHPNLNPEEVLKYIPLGNMCATVCDGFEIGTPEEFDEIDLELAEEYSREKYGDVTYRGVRDWLNDEYGYDF